MQKRSGHIGKNTWLLPAFNFFNDQKPEDLTRKLPKIISVIILCSIAGSALGAPKYKIIDLGYLPGHETLVPEDVNDSGQFTGFSDKPNGKIHAFVGDVHGSLNDLDTLGGERSQGLAINDGGEVVGYSETANGNPHAFFGNASGITDLGTLGGDNSVARAVNDSGQVAGSSETANGDSHAFIGDASGLTDLGTLGGDNSWGRAINDRGQVAGLSETASGKSHVFIGDADDLADLGQLEGGRITSIEGISNDDQIIGIRQKGNGHHKIGRAFVADIKNGSLDVIDIPLLNGKNHNTVQAINDRGQVVGEANQVRIIEKNGMTYYMNSHPRAFLYDIDDGVIYDLNDLVVNKKGWGIIRNATGINNKGDIVGFNKNRAFLLVPAGRE